MRVLFFLVIVSIIAVSCSDRKVKKEPPKEEEKYTQIESIPDSLIVGNWRLRSLVYSKEKGKNNIGVSYHSPYKLKFKDSIFLTLEENKSVRLQNVECGKWNQESRGLRFSLDKSDANFPLPEGFYQLQRTKYLLKLRRMEGGYRYEYHFILQNSPASR